MATAHPESQCLAVSVNDIKGGYEYPEVVRFEIEEQDLSSYLRAAEFLNISNVDIVCLQHEFGIFGGTAGGHILAFLRELRMPVVTTLHTVLREPRPDTTASDAGVDFTVYTAGCHGGAGADDAEGNLPGRHKQKSI